MAKKRSNGEGSFWQLSDRTWVYQITVGRKENGAPERKPSKAARKRSANSAKRNGKHSRPR